MDNTKEEKILADEFGVEMETVDANDIPVFSIGKWEGKGSAPGGDNITSSTLEQWVSTFQKIGSKIKPRLRLSHDLSKSNGATGMASLGWVTGLRTDGETLFANFKNIPKKIWRLIEKKAFGRFSPGVFKKINVNGQDFEGVLEHIALLGAQLPANMDLDGFIDLYYENENNIDYNEICIYENYKGATMDFEAKVLELEKTLELQLKENELRIKEFESKIDGLSNDKAELENQVKTAEFEKQKSEVVSFLAKQVDDKKITPAQKTSYEKLLVPEGESMEFSKSFDIVKDIIKDGSVELPVDEQSVSADTSDKAYSKDEEPKEPVDLDVEIKAYMEKNDVEDYGEAYNAVTYQKLEKEREENVS